MIRKSIAMMVMPLFVGVCIVPSTGNINVSTKIVPFGVTISFDPSEPDGDNGWYVTYVKVYFHPDNGTIIKEIYIRFDGGSWQIFTYHELDWEGNHTYDFSVVDTDGNQWYFGPYIIKIAVTPPNIKEVEWETYKEHGWWYCEFTCNAVNNTSGMDRVELWVLGEWLEIIEGSGPIYKFVPFYLEIIKNMVYFYYYDKAGNLIINSVDGNNITLYPNCKSYNIFFFRLLDRFSILQWFFNILEVYKIN